MIGIKTRCMPTRLRVAARSSVASALRHLYVGCGLQVAGALGWAPGPSDNLPVKQPARQTAGPPNSRPVSEPARQPIHKCSVPRSGGVSKPRSRCTAKDGREWGETVAINGPCRSVDRLIAAKAIEQVAESRCRPDAILPRRGALWRLGASCDVIGVCLGQWFVLDKDGQITTLSFRRMVIRIAGSDERCKRRWAHLPDKKRPAGNMRSAAWWCG